MCIKQPGSISLESTIGTLGGHWHHAEIPAEVARHFKGSYPVRVLCTVNKVLTFHCALMSMGNGRSFITISKQRMKQAKVKPGDTVSLMLEADNSEYGMPMPEELAILLEQDEEGNRRFTILTGGKKRNIIHYVSSVKNPQLKIDRAIMLIENRSYLKIKYRCLRCWNWVNGYSFYSLTGKTDDMKKGGLFIRLLITNTNNYN